MKRNSFLGILILLAVALMFMGCGEVPQTDIDDAKAALDGAKAVEADRYVPEMYNAANQTLNGAMAIVEEEKSGMFSNYDEAVVLLQKAKTEATSAAEAVPAKKEEIQSEIDALLAQIPDVVKETKMKWKKAPRGKGTHEPLQLIKQDIAATEESVSEVTATAEQGDLLAARQKAQDIINKLKKLQAELQ